MSCVPLCLRRKWCKDSVIKRLPNRNLNNDVQTEKPHPPRNIRYHEKYESELSNKQEINYKNEQRRVVLPMQIFPRYRDHVRKQESKIFIYDVKDTNNYIKELKLVLMFTKKKPKNKNSKSNEHIVTKFGVYKQEMPTDAIMAKPKMTATFHKMLKVKKADEHNLLKSRYLLDIGAKPKITDNFNKMLKRKKPEEHSLLKSRFLLFDVGESKKVSESKKISESKMLKPKPIKAKINKYLDLPIPIKPKVSKSFRNMLKSVNPKKPEAHTILKSRHLLHESPKEKKVPKIKAQKLQRITKKTKRTVEPQEEVEPSLPKSKRIFNIKDDEAVPKIKVVKSKIFNIPKMKEIALETINIKPKTTHHFNKMLENINRKAPEGHTLLKSQHAILKSKGKHKRNTLETGKPKKEFTMNTVNLRKSNEETGRKSSSHGEVHKSKGHSTSDILAGQTLLRKWTIQYINLVNEIETSDTERNSLESLLSSSSNESQEQTELVSNTKSYVNVDIPIPKRLYRLSAIGPVNYKGQEIMPNFSAHKMKEDEEISLSALIFKESLSKKSVSSDVLQLKKKRTKRSYTKRWKNKLLDLDEEKIKEKIGELMKHVAIREDEPVKRPQRNFVVEAQNRKWETRKPRTEAIEKKVMKLKFPTKLEIIPIPSELKSHSKPLIIRRYYTMHNIPNEPAKDDNFEHSPSNYDLPIPAMKQRDTPLIQEMKSKLLRMELRSYCRNLELKDSLDCKNITRSVNQCNCDCKL